MSERKPAPDGLTRCATRNGRTAHLVSSDTYAVRDYVLPIALCGMEDVTAPWRDSYPDCRKCFKLAKARSRT